MLPEDVPELQELQEVAALCKRYEERKRELIDIFVTGVENEYMFWASAYDMQYTWKPEWNQAR